MTRTLNVAGRRRAGGGTVALNSYMDDPRRHALLAEFGDVFTSEQAVEVELLGDTPMT